jgi:hypothetical protein
LRGTSRASSTALRMSDSGIADNFPFQLVYSTARLGLLMICLAGWKYILAPFRLGRRPTHRLRRHDGGGGCGLCGLGDRVRRRFGERSRLCRHCGVGGWFHCRLSGCSRLCRHRGTGGWFHCRFSGCSRLCGRRRAGG